jgi:hypothetical protein
VNNELYSDMLEVFMVFQFFTVCSRVGGGGGVLHMNGVVHAMKAYGGVEDSSTHSCPQH